MYDTDKQDIKSVIFSGCSVEKAGVSICNLTNHIAFRLGSKSGSYQSESLYKIKRTDFLFDCCKKFFNEGNNNPLVECVFE